MTIHACIVHTGLIFLSSSVLHGSKRQGRAAEQWCRMKHAANIQGINSNKRLAVEIAMIQENSPVQVRCSE